MFYRPGGSATRINAQYDYIFSDTIGDATGWLPVNKGYTMAVNVAKAFIAFASAVQSKVTKVAIAPEVLVVLEMKVGGEADDEAFVLKTWENELIAEPEICAGRAGFVRLRILNLNNDGGTSGVAMAIQVNRTGTIS